MTADRWQLVSQIFAAARERDPAHHAPFLDEACGSDAALRAEVEALLAHDLPSVAAIDVVATELASAPYPQPGAILGPYRLGELIGEGGMGQVFRAHDAELGRDVAIKFLPPLYASDPDRRARFEREARVLASLNHPHIAAIYGIAEWGSVRGLVLELVDGDTLADRIERTASSKQGLPLDDALTIAIQIADAVDAAHAKGIVHRDLKPQNVKIGADGRVKVLDFGLAKAIGDERVVPPAGALSPTSHPVDATFIAGTAPYMSPEQRQGHAVDQRTDVWAFGCVLYEMLCGQRAFAERMARIHARNPGPGLGGAAARNPRRADRLAAASARTGSGTSSLEPGRSAWCAGALPGRPAPEQAGAPVPCTADCGGGRAGGGGIVRRVALDRLLEGWSPSPRSTRSRCCRCAISPGTKRSKT